MLIDINYMVTTVTGSAFVLEHTRKHDLEGNGLPNRA